MVSARTSARSMSDNRLWVESNPREAGFSEIAMALRKNRAAANLLMVDQRISGASRRT